MWPGSRRFIVLPLSRAEYGREVEESEEEDQRQESDGSDGVLSVTHRSHAPVVSPP